MAEAREAAEEGSALAAAAGLRAEAKVVVAEGIAWRALVDAAAEVEADAIVCGSRGHGAAVRAVLGSVASGLVRHAPVPVLVVPHEARSTTGPALVAFDGSAPASAAIRAAGRLLTAHEAVVLHVWKSTVRHSLTGSALRHAVLPEVRELTKDLDDAFEQAAQDVSDRGLAEAQEAGLRARARTFESDAPTAQAIMAVAGELDASSIVVGRRGRGAMAEALLGSVSSSLVHTSDRPVLVATS
jgi:nucleotide-binding universal stress UspA family protein